MPCPCCDQGCCCIDNAPDNTKTTQAACESAGGTWHNDGSCASESVDCRCCGEFKYICYETIYSVYSSVSFQANQSAWTPAPTPSPGANTIGYIIGDIAQGGPFQTYCRGSEVPGQAGERDFHCDGTPGNQPGSINVWYTRVNLVDNCEDCDSEDFQSDGGCATGTRKTCGGQLGQDPLWCPCAAISSIDPCADNPAP
jgi:hypothetical protein